MCRNRINRLGRQKRQNSGFSHSLALGSAADHTNSRKTLAPFIGIARGVKDAVNGHHVLDILVEHRIWKAAHQPAAIILMDDGMHLGCTADRFQKCLDTPQNSSPKPVRRPSYQAYASAMSCSASGAMMNSAAIAASNPLFDFFPRESRGGVSHQVGFSPG
jgi:hypothetical protein